MSKLPDGGPAFPRTGFGVYGSHVSSRRHAETDPQDGMSLRAYAAIKLRVPESGISWLDAMIERSRRDQLAGQALAGAVSREDFGTIDPYSTTLNCYAMADAMLAAEKQT